MVFEVADSETFCDMIASAVDAARNRKMAFAYRQDPLRAGDYLERAKDCSEQASFLLDLFMYEQATAARQG